MNITWDEKNYTGQEKNCLNNSGREPIDITSGTNFDLTPPQCKNIGGVKKQHEIATKRLWNLKNKERIKIKRREMAKINIELKKFTRNCSGCGKPHTYSNIGALNAAAKNDRMCVTCTRNSPEFKEKISKSRKGRPNVWARKRPYESIFNTMIRNAIFRNIHCDITYEEFFEFTKVKTCAYCKTEIKWQAHASNRRGRNVASNLDRMDNTVGYRKSNCCVCCQMCNSIKNKFFSHEEMLEIGELVRNILNKRTQ